MSNISLTGGGAAGGSGSSTASSGSTTPSSKGGAGAGIGSGFSWIGGIFQVLGGVTTSAFAMDQNNRAYKYDLYARPTKPDNSMLIILFIASAVLIVTVLIIFSVKAPNQ